MAKGVFITFEGGEGAGKSTQVKKLAEYLKGKDIDSVLTREPGGSPGAEEIRSIILSGKKDKWDSLSEILLFSAARRNHLTQVIWPNIDAGRWVICDRFADSTMAYQGYGRNDNLLSQSDIQSLYKLIAGDFKPDVTFILDIPPEKGLERAFNRGTTNRMEDMDMSFHHNLRKAFLDIARQEPERCVVLDALKSPEALHEEIITILRKRFL